MHAGVVACVFALAAADTPGVKQVLTFEKDESLKFGEYKEDHGDTMVVRYNAYGSYHYMARGDATQGEWAISRRFRTYDPFAKGYSEGALASVQREGRLFNGFGWMVRLGLAGDWSAYDRLWMDVKSADAPARIQVRVLDPLAVPVPARVYGIPAGKWVTLEFNLADAADVKRLEAVPVKAGEGRFFRCLDSALYAARALDRSNVIGVFVNVIKVDAPSTLLLDNLRLVPAGAKADASLPVVKDASAWPKPEALPLTTEPKPAMYAKPGGGAKLLLKQPTERDGPISIDLTALRSVSYGRLHNDRGGLAVADANRTAVSLEVGMDRCVLVTADGGKTWTGLDGQAAPTSLFGALMMVGATSTPAADGPDLLTVTLLHCSGGEEPSAVYFKKVAFTGGGGWQPGPLRVMDVDSWHCSEHTMDVLRLPNGRLWAAWTPTIRTGGLGVTARYSDDDGATWRDLGDNGVIGGRGRPLLIPYGDGVACFRVVGWQEYPIWSYTRDGRWSEPQRLLGNEQGYSIAAGAALGKSLFLALGRRPRLLRLDGEQWVDEKPPFVPTRLSVAGDRLIGLAVQEKRTVFMTIRSAGGVWSQPRTLATEEMDIMDLVVPMHAPPGWVPVAWAPTNHRWIKFLRVPLDEVDRP